MGEDTGNGGWEAPVGRLSWQAGSGALGGWLAEIADRFGVSSGKLQIECRKRVWHYAGPPNGSPYSDEISSIHVSTMEALASEFVSDHVQNMTFTVYSPDDWHLSATPGDHSQTAGITLRMPRAASWPLPAILRDSRDLHGLLDKLAGVIGVTPPDHALVVNERYPRQIDLRARVTSSRYQMTVSGWGREPFNLCGDTRSLVDDLSGLFQPRDETPFPLRSLGAFVHVRDALRAELRRRWAAPIPLRSLGDLVHLYNTLRAALGRGPGGDALSTPDPDVRLPPDTHVIVKWNAAKNASFVVAAGDLLVEADHPFLSLRGRLALLLCPQLYTPCPAEHLPTWLRSLEKGVFGRPGIWSVHNRNWCPPRLNGTGMVTRALLDQGVTGQAWVELACAEFLAIRGLMLGGEPVELLGRSRLTAPPSLE